MSSVSAELGERGAVIIPACFTAEEVRMMRDECSRLIAGGRSGARPGILDLDQHDSVRRIFNPIDRSTVFERIAMDRRVIAPICDSLGPNVELHHSKINIKQPLIGPEVKWHQDFVFLPHTNASLVAASVFLDTSDESNGAMEFLPGSHRAGPLSHSDGQKFTGYVEAGIIESATRRFGRELFAVRAGDVVLHHSLTLHYSAPNHSQRQRRVLIVLYRSADAHALGANDCGSRLCGHLVAGHRMPARTETKIKVSVPTFANDGPLSIFDLQHTDD